MGYYALAGVCYLCDSNDWSAWVNWVEGNGNFFKLYSINVDFKYGYEHTCYC